MDAQIQQILNDPQYERNIHGRLKALLALIDRKTQQQLACDFAEHVVPIYHTLQQYDSRLNDAIDMTRCFINDQILTPQFVDMHSEIFDLQANLKRDKAHYRSIAAGEVAAAVSDAILVAAQDALVEADLLIKQPKKHQRNVQQVAETATRAVAQAFGGEHWRSSDRTLKESARKRGKQASDEEVQWQLEHVYQILNIPLA
jgi:hypothetical protein